MYLNRWALLFLCLSARAMAQGRERLSMDPQWRFALGDQAGAERPAFDDRSWRRVDLPHDWSIEGTMRQDAPGRGQFAFLPGGIEFVLSQGSTDGSLSTAYASASARTSVTSLSFGWPTDDRT